MPVIYDSKKLIPAPLISINTSYQRAGDSTKIGKIYEISVKGKFVAYKGSPNSSGTFYTGSTYPDDEVIVQSGRQEAIANKQEALRDLFSEDGLLFEIMPWNGEPPMKCRPRVKSISFPEGIWTETCDYTVELETDKLITGLSHLSPYEDNESESDILQNYNVSEVSEDWSIELDSEVFGIFKVVHNVGAVGKRVFDDDTGEVLAEAWQRAKSFVESRLGYNPVYAESGTIGIPDAVYNNYNHVRSETINRYTGQFSVVENWILSTGSAYESYNVEVRNTNDQESFTTVNVNGTVVGLDDVNIIGTGVGGSNGFPKDGGYKYFNASGLWNGTGSGAAVAASSQIYQRALQYSNLTFLNVVPVSQTVGHNLNQGQITYNFEYSTKPPNCISGAKSEVITINEENIDGDIDSFASVVVIGRGQGPVLQPLNTTVVRRREISLEVVMPTPTSTCEIQQALNAKPNAVALLAAYAPTGYQVLKDRDSESWSPKAGRYSRNIGYTYEI